MGNLHTTIIPRTYSVLTRYLPGAYPVLTPYLPSTYHVPTHLFFAQLGNSFKNIPTTTETQNNLFKFISFLSINKAAYFFRKYIVMFWIALHLSFVEYIGTIGWLYVWAKCKPPFFSAKFIYCTDGEKCMRRVFFSTMFSVWRKDEAGYIWDGLSH